MLLKIIKSLLIVILLTQMLVRSLLTHLYYKIYGKIYYKNKQKKIIAEWSNKKKLSQIVSHTCRLGNRVLGIKTIVTGNYNLMKGQNFLIVSNHLSYLDIFVLASIFPANYVTSQEIKEMFFLGEITQLTGCLFVERRNKHNIIKEISDITNGLTNGLNVVIFPEATSTNGESVLRFRRPLFNAAINSKTAILPIAINYLTINGETITKKNRDQLFWYGDMSFSPHFWQLLALHEIKVSVNFLQPIYYQDNYDCENLANLSYQQVLSNYRPI